MLSMISWRLTQYCNSQCRKHGVSVLLLFSFIFFPVESKASWYKQQQNIMGTQIVVDIWHKDTTIAKQCSDRVFVEMKRIDELMSPYKSESELARINQYAAERYVKVGDELFDLIKFSQTISESSKGAFDITFASIGYLYDYRQKKKPSDKVIKDRLKFIDYRNIKLN